MLKVLFVCLGNICRSPTAEGVFNHLIRQKHLEHRITVESGGTSGWHIGEPPDLRTQQEALRRGIDLGGLRGRGVFREDFDQFDYIVAMDEDNLSALRRICPKALHGKLYLFTDFAPKLGLTAVPDPYYGGAQGFARVFDIVQACANGLLAAMDADDFQGRPLLQRQPAGR